MFIKKLNRIFLCTAVFTLLISYSTQNNLAEDIKTTNFPGTYLLKILSEQEEETVVILDVDDTIISSPKETWLSSSVAFYDLYAELERSNAEKTKKCKGTLDPLLEQTYIHITSELTDPRVPEAINAFKEAGATVIALTARGMKIFESTEKQLTGLKIALSPVTVDAPFNLYETTFEKRLKILNGIVMGNHDHTKGEMVTALITLKKIPATTKKIIMIDDKKTHLKDVEDKLKKTTLYTTNKITWLPVHCTYPKKIKSEYTMTAKEEMRSQLESFIWKYENTPEMKELLLNDFFTQYFLSTRSQSSAYASSHNSMKKELNLWSKDTMLNEKNSEIIEQLTNNTDGITDVLISRKQRNIILNLKMYKKYINYIETSNK